MYIAYASTTGTTQTGGWMSWVLILAMFAVLYFVMIRPQNKRDKEARNMRNNLKPGDEIVTIGGIYGKIVRVTEDRVIIMVGSEKTKLEMAKSAISGLANPSSSSSSSSSSASKAKDTAADVEANVAGKPSPKNIKKLGAKKAEAEEVVEEAKDAAEAAAEEVAEAAEVIEEAAEDLKG